MSDIAQRILLSRSGCTCLVTDPLAGLRHAVRRPTDGRGLYAELTSQGDKEQIYVKGAGTAHQALTVLTLTDSVDDTVWASSRSGAIYASNGSNDTVEKITGPFVKGQAYVADTPCDAGNAPSTGPGFPANVLGALNISTGTITPVAVHGSKPAPGGMLFLQ